jgi:hypothetical protein
MPGGRKKEAMTNDCNLSDHIGKVDYRSLVTPQGASAADAATHYARCGLAPIPVPHRGKNPGRKADGGSGAGWQNARVGPGDVPRVFGDGPRNVGVLLGEPSGGLVDVDLDCPQTVALAPVLLPATGAVFGRPGKPRSHWLYIADPVPAATQQWKDVDGTTLVELRSTGGQTVFPPSTHESGEPVEWAAGDGVPAAAHGSVLRDQVATLAAAALLVRHYPKEGSRHHLAMALASVLLRAGRAVEDVELMIGAVARAAGDEEPEDRLACVGSTETRLGRAGKATGVPRLKEILGPAVGDRLLTFLNVCDAGPDADAEAVDAAVEVVERVADETRRWPAPLGEAAFHGLAGEIVRRIDPHTEGDPVAVLIHLLTGIGNAIGRGVHFKVGGAEHHMNLFAACVGKTAKGRKGTAQADTFRLLRQVDEPWATQRVQTGLSSGEGLIWAVRDPIHKPERDRKTGVVESVLVDEGIADKRLLVVEPELASVLRRMGRESNTLSAVLRLAWDSGDLRVLTKNTPAAASGAHVSVIGHVTEEELRRELTGTETANGFANRFLWVCVERSKMLPEGGALYTVDFTDHLARLRKVFEYAKPGVIDVLQRDAAAKELWAAVYPDLSAGQSGLLGAVTSRAEAQVMRLAGLYALLDLSAIVRPEHLLAALEVWRYAEESARYIFGGSLGDQVADDILAALRRAPVGVSRTDISRLFSGHKDAQQIGRALALLQRNRLARCVVHKDTGGRAGEHWFAFTAGEKEAG